MKSRSHGCACTARTPSSRSVRPATAAGPIIRVSARATRSTCSGHTFSPPGALPAGHPAASRSWRYSNQLRCEHRPCARRRSGTCSHGERPKVSRRSPCRQLSARACASRSCHSVLLNATTGSTHRPSPSHIACSPQSACREHCTTPPRCSATTHTPAASLPPMQRMFTPAAASSPRSQSASAAHVCSWGSPHVCAPQPSAAAAGCCTSRARRSSGGHRAAFSGPSAFSGHASSRPAVCQTPPRIAQGTSVLRAPHASRKRKSSPSPCTGGASGGTGTAGSARARTSRRVQKRMLLKSCSGSPKVRARQAPTTPKWFVPSERLVSAAWR